MLPIDFFLRASLVHPQRVAVASPEGQITYAQLRAKVDALAVALQRTDPQPGSIVGLCAQNSPGYIVAMLAIMAAGKVWMPLNYRSTAGETQRIIDATSPSILIADDTGAALTQGADAHHLGLEQLDALCSKFQGSAPVRHVRGRDDTQAIKFTGGTTGLPKGVMQPCRAWAAGIVNQIHGWGITSQDNFVICAPISHGTGTYMLPMLAQGARLTLCASNSATDIARAFSQGGTMTFMPPTLIYKLMADPAISAQSFASLRLLIYGGAPMPVEKIGMVQKFFGPVVATTYGQTEAPQIATLLRPEDLVRDEYRASVGRATWFTDLAILSPEGQELEPNQIGEVCIRGDLVMTGYWKLPEKTAETIKNGWLHTGDVGYLDERGYLFLKERLRDVIITGGFNVYPIDVENVLSTHPAVHEAAVFGMPDDKWGETVNAALELKPGQALADEEVKAFVREKLGPVLTPKNIYFYASLPRSPVGKVLKTAIQADTANKLRGQTADA
jgi:fatty-acyl-CoA synthase